MKFFLGVILSLSLVSVSATATLDRSEVDKELQKLEKSFGVHSKDFTMYATTGEGEGLKVLIDVNGKTVMIPASITKIATTSAVLANFPPGYKFKTQLLASGKVEHGVLKGNLYLKGGGDPSFVSENMWFLVNYFLRNDVKKIEGDIIVDDSLLIKCAMIKVDREKELIGPTMLQLAPCHSIGTR